MISLERIRVPTLFILLIAYGVVLFSPLCPVQVHRTQSPSLCPPGENCVTESDYLEVQPVIISLASGITWTGGATWTDAGVEYEFSANAAVAIALLLVPFLPVLIMHMRSKKGERDGKSLRSWRHIVLPRRPWRISIWTIGLWFLLLSALWAWAYMIFYGGLTCAATIDPLLTSTLSTFILSGMGLATMMFAVRSKAIWPAQKD